MSFEQLHFKRLQWTAIFVVMASIVGVLLYKLVVAETAANAREIIAAICVAATLVVLLPSLGRLKSISVAGLKAEVREIKRKTDRNEQTIVDLLFLSMGRDTYFNLKKLADGLFKGYRKPHGEGLETELYHLRNLGYLQLKNGLPYKAIKELPEEGDDLQAFVEVTDAGRKYIDLREKHRSG